MHARACASVYSTQLKKAKTGIFFLPHPAHTFRLPQNAHLASSRKVDHPRKTPLP